MMRACFGAAAGLLMLPAFASAQDVHTFDPTLLRPGETLWVTTDVVQKGTLVRADQDGLTLATTSGERTIGIARIRGDGIARIERRGDRLRDGTLIGMTIGFAVPTAIFIGLAQPHTSAGEIMSALFTTELGFPWGLLGAGIGAAAGAGIDAMRVGRTTVYVSPRNTSGVTIAPLLGKDRRGALVSVRF